MKENGANNNIANVSLQLSHKKLMTIIVDCIDGQIVQFTVY